MNYRHSRTVCLSACGLVLAAACLCCAWTPARAEYLVAPSSVANTVHLAVDCPSDWSLAGEVLSSPAWMTRLAVEGTRDESGQGVRLAFDVDPLAPLSASGTLVLSLTARDARGEIADRVVRRLPLRLAAAVPPVQRSFRVEECCLLLAGFDGAMEGRPQRPVLLGATPNPWSNRTAIRFGLPSGGSVTLRILDVAGRLLQEFHAPDLGPGYHQISWDGRDPDGQRMPPGLYFYEVSSDRWAKTGKTLLLR